MFPDREVQEFVFDGVVNRHVVLGLQIGGSMDMTTLTKVKAVSPDLLLSFQVFLSKKYLILGMHRIAIIVVRWFEGWRIFATVGTVVQNARSHRR